MPLKYTAILVIALCSFSTSYSQLAAKLHVELGVIRYNKTQGLFPPMYYNNQSSYLNGFEIGYELSPKFSVVIGTRLLQETIKPDYPYYGHEFTDVTGKEINLGIEYIANKEKRFHLGYNLELFGEFTKHVGHYSQDYPPYETEINHRKQFMGIAPEVKLYFRIADRLKLVAGSRIRFGFVEVKQIGSTRNDLPLFHSVSYRTTVFDPINTVGIRFEM